MQSAQCESTARCARQTVHCTLRTEAREHCVVQRLLHHAHCAAQRAVCTVIDAPWTVSCAM
eukprot:10677990-Lingulodinium_polyedra.AAC.1